MNPEFWPEGVALNMFFSETNCQNLRKEATAYAKSKNNSNKENHYNMKVYYQNVRGLRTKFRDLTVSTETTEYHVMIFSETWLDDGIWVWSLVCTTATSTDEIY